MTGRTLIVTTLLAAGLLMSTDAFASTAAERGPAFSHLGPEPGGGIRVHVDRAGLDRVVDEGDGRIVVPFMVTAEESVDLELERFRVTNGDTRFVVGRGNTPLDVDPDRVTLLRGHVRGDIGSQVYLALSPSGGLGHIDRGPGRSRFAIAPANRGDAATLVVRPDPSGGGGGLGVPLCATAVDDIVAPGPAAGILAAGDIRQIELAIETDYEYFELFGDLDAAGDYIVTLYGAVSDIYIRDADMTFLLTFVRLWDTEADLFNEENPLGAFVAYWESEMGGVQRDVAQFTSGRRNMPFGGIAYVNALCGDFGYSAIGYVLGFFADGYLSEISWRNRDISLAAHELGHNVAAPHTHSIGIDQCDNPETSPQRGTVMAYCGQTFTGGDGNKDVRFHTEIQTILRGAIVEDECVGSDCNLNGVDDADEIASGVAFDSNEDGIPDECQDCNDNGTLDDADITGGDSLDLNGNGLPDECEPDCNGNGFPDDVDIMTGQSLDAYGNGIPDECETDCDGDRTSDYTELNVDMSLDLNRNARLDDCEDCDGDGTTDLDALAGANNLWVADQVATHLRQYVWPSGVETDPSDDGGLSLPQDVLALPDGRVLVTSRDDDRIIAFAIDGTLIGDFAPPGAGGLLQPAAMVVASGGDVLVASANHRVLRFGADGSILGEFVTAGAGGLDGPFGMAFGPDGAFYVTDADDEVLRFDGSTGTFIDTFVSAAGNGGLSDPRGIAFLPDGDLLVASRETSQVLRYDGATGEFLGQFNRNGTDTVMTLDQPWTIRIGPDGGVYVSRAHDHEEHGNEGTPGTSAGSHLHLTNARIYHFDPANGNMLRAIVQGLNSNLVHPTGFDFVPNAGLDCNTNSLPDSCDIAAGTSLDRNGNGVPDECESPCVGDLDGSGDVGFTDLLSALSAWGPCAGCPQDLDGSGDVGFTDLLTILSAWGDCG